MRYRIGKVAEIFGVTTKTLRHYDAEGLLHPAHVDSDTGYRSYSGRQFPRLATILELRAEGYSLPEIRDYINEPSTERRLQRIRERQARLDAEMERLRQLKAMNEWYLTWVQTAAAGVSVDELRFEVLDERSLWRFPPGVTIETFFGQFGRLGDQMLHDLGVGDDVQPLFCALHHIDPEDPEAKLIRTDAPEDAYFAAIAGFLVPGAYSHSAVVSIPRGRWARWAYRGAATGRPAALRNARRALHRAGQTPEGTVVEWPVIDSLVNDHESAWITELQILLRDS